MNREQYAIYTEDGTLVGSVEVIGEDEQDSQELLDAYLAELEDEKKKENQ